MSFLNKEIIIIKKENIFLIITFIAGIGALSLSYLWYADCYIYGYSCFKNDYWNGINIKSSQSELNFILIYYLVNSFLLIFLSFVLIFKKYRLHAFLSIALATSVIFSLFTDIGGNRVLFSTTVFSGMYAWWFGTILIPMFLYYVYANAKKGFKYLKNSSNSTIEKIN